MKQTKKIVLCAFLLAGILAINTEQEIFAAETASQTLSASLGLMRKISTNGGVIGSSINPDTGNLVTAFSPGFRIETNTATPTATIDLYATCQGATTQQAIYDRSGTRYIILANTTVPTTDAAILSCKDAVPVETDNPNAISYAVTEPASITGLSYAWTPPSKWVATLSKKGKTDTALNIPAGPAYAGTYSGDDEQGSYQAVVTMAFNPL